MSHSNYSNLQVDDERSSPENGVFFFRAIRREEVSSLPAAGSARHPPPTTAGLFETVTKVYARTPLIIAGQLPSCRQSGSFRGDKSVLSKPRARRPLRVPTIRHFLTLRTFIPGA